MEDESKGSQKSSKQPSKSESRRKEETAEEEKEELLDKSSKAQSVKIPIEKTQSTGHDSIARQVEEIQKQLAEFKVQKQYSNPAVLGLCAFGLTTLLLQCHNTGWMQGYGTVVWTGLIFGGLVQWIAGILEFKVGNNFGYLAFTAYGAFWMAFAFMSIGNSHGLFKPPCGGYGKPTAFLLLVYGAFTLCMCFGTACISMALFITFVLLFLGFLFLGVGHLIEGRNHEVGHALNRIAAYDLLLCALGAWYCMLHVLFGVVLPCKNPVPAGPAPVELIKKIRGKKKDKGTKL